MTTYLNHPRWGETIATIQQKCPKKFQSDRGISTVEQAQKQFPQALLFNESIPHQSQ
jgi:hypothetical protein